MKSQFRTLFFSTTALAAMFAFQNCSQVGFTSNGLLGAESPAPTGTLATSNNPPNPATTSDDPTTSGAPAPKPSPTTTTTTTTVSNPPGNSNPNKPTSGTGDGTTPPGTSSGTTTGTGTTTTTTGTGTGTTTGTGTETDDTDVVECDLGGSSDKIILSQELETGSNASETRICMSQNACLSIINTYAAERGCTLAAGAETTPKSTAVCTQIFPGSNGTCNNAKILSDTDVTNLLKKMSGT